MASNITHYFFAKHVTSFLREDARVVAEKYPKHFLIGNQGPDLFFYHLTSKKKIVGGFIHDLPLRDFLLRNRQLILSRPVDSPTWAYLLGLLCHFSLDIAFHPYIDSIEKRINIKHITIEREFDRYLLKKEGIRNDFSLINAIIPHPDDVADAILPLYSPYFDVNIHDIRQALYSFRIALRFFSVRDEKQRQRKLKLMEALGMNAFMGMLMKPGGYFESDYITTPALAQLMALAYPIAKEATSAIYQRPQNYPEFFNLNFNGR